MKKDLVAGTPPMGWNSWDCYGAGVNEEQLLGNAQYMAEHLKAHGWQYVVCDIQWAEPQGGTHASDGHDYIDFAPLVLDAYGRQMPAENRFPSAKGGKGFTPIADKIHAMGLKFGIHIMRGIPRQAVAQRLPVLGTDKTADQVASPSSICGWNGDMYGLDAHKEGAQAYYDSIFQLYASWGVDFVKVDDICNTNMYPHNPYSAKAEIEMIRHAIDACGRDMVLSLSPGPAVIEQAWHMSRNANMWRMTNDFWDDWKALKHMFERCEVWQAHVGNGCWPDCDMLPLGRIGIGFSKPRPTNFTPDEQRTVMNLWGIFRSPLMMGGEMRDNDAATLALLTNDELLYLNQHGGQPLQLSRDDAQATWFNTDDKGNAYLGLFNLSDEASEVCVDFAASELPFAKAQAKELWTGESRTAQGALAVQLAPHASALYKITM